MNQSPQNHSSIPPEVIDKLKPNQTSKNMHAKTCRYKLAFVSCIRRKVISSSVITEHLT